MVHRILILDSDKGRVQEVSCCMAKSSGFEVRTHQSGTDGLKWMLEANEAPDLVIYHISEDNKALEVIRSMHQLYSAMPILAMVPFTGHQLGIQAMQAGAEMFLISPFPSSQLQAVVKLSLQKRELYREVERLSGWNEHCTLNDFSAKSELLQTVMQLSRNAAVLDMPVILDGREGAGKGILARAIHGSGRNSDHPFINVNLAILKPGEIEGKLFGSHNSAGALTRTGKGTLFIRGIEYLPFPLEKKLLHSLKDKKLFSGRWMLAAPAAPNGMNRQTMSVMKLFTSVQHIAISLPSLSQMREDIPMLARKFCQYFACVEGKPIWGISGEAAELLQTISWPGNMRELSHTVFHAVMACSTNELQVEDFGYLFNGYRNNKRNEEGKFPVNIHGKVLSCFDESGNVKRLEEVEQEMIHFALECYGGHMSKAARKLGIGRSTLYRKLAIAE